MIQFNETGLNQEILEAISDMGFVTPTPIQEKTISHLLNSKRDLVGLAQTGTGKTAAFGLPIIQQVDPAVYTIQALILCPTRELCMQITRDFASFSKYLPRIKTLAIYGGASIDKQIRALEKGVQIVVGTPGRVIDLIDRGKLRIDRIAWLVLDEADEMLNMGFKEDLDEILKSVKSEHQTLLFSATMPPEIARISQNYMKEPDEFAAGEKNTVAENVLHHFYVVHARDKYAALRRIADANPDIYGIVFCRTREETQDIADKLIQDGYNADALHGNLSQAQRDLVMNRFRTQRLQLLVATDVAARGLDVSNLTHIINYSIPEDPDIYLHRSGRTGRAGKSGLSISIIHSREKDQLGQIAIRSNIEIEQQKIPDGISICESQLYHLVERVVNTEVNMEQIERFLPRIYEKLAGLSRDELVQRFIWVEFNAFLKFYKDAPDLNLGPSSIREYERESYRAKQAKGVRFSRFFINLGSRDDLDKANMIKFLAGQIKNRAIAIGRVDILKNFSFFEVESDYEDEVRKSFELAEFKGRLVNVELANRGEGGGRRPEKKNFRKRR